LIGGGFYRPERRVRGAQWVAGAGCAGDVHGRHWPRRPCSRAGGVLSRPRSAVGRCWRGHGGRELAEREKEKRGGSGCCLPLLLPFSQLGSGQRELGSTAASSTSMAIGTRGTGAVIFTVKSISSDFCSPGIRHNARKRFKFEILKISTLGDQHISQGFQ
jgi:hypothetical protein